MALISPRYLSFHIRLVVFLFSFPKKERFSLDRMRILMHLHLHIYLRYTTNYKKHMKKFGICHLTDIPATCHIAEPRVRDIVQGVLDYRDLNYHEFAIPELIKYSNYSSNSGDSSTIIRISIILGNCFWTLSSR